MAEKLRTLDFSDGKGARVLVPDWENVDNKPFGVEPTILVDNETPTVVDGNGMLILTPAIALVVGEEYTVIYNGVEYNVTATELNDVPGFGSGVMVGNGAMFGASNTGEPFLMGYSPETGGSLLIPLDSPENIVLTVIRKGIKKIDAKCISATYFYVAEGDNYIYADAEMTKKVTATDLLVVKDNVKLIGNFDVANGSNHQFNDVKSYVTPSAISVTGSSLMCTVMVPIGGGTVKHYEFFTAEYTG